MFFLCISSNLHRNWLTADYILLAISCLFPHRPIFLYERLSPNQSCGQHVQVVISHALLTLCFQKYNPFIFFQNMNQNVSLIHNKHKSKQNLRYTRSKVWKWSKNRVLLPITPPNKLKIQSPTWRPVQYMDLKVGVSNSITKLSTTLPISQIIKL